MRALGAYPPAFSVYKRTRVGNHYLEDTLVISSKSGAEEIRMGTTPFMGNNTHSYL